MLTQENDVDVHALARQGWTVSAIARHLGHDRKTIRAYLSGGRVAGQRAPAASAADPLEVFVDYLRQRLVDDPHVWAVVLFDEAVRLTKGGLRQSSGRRPAPCASPASDRATALPSQPAVIVRHNDVGKVSTRPWADPDPGPRHC